MIKYEIDNGHMGVLEASGSTKLIAAEALNLIANLYSALCKSGPGPVADLFRAAITASIAAPESPVWVPDNSVEGIFFSRPIRGGESDE